MDIFDINPAKLSKFINIQLTYNSFIYVSSVRTENPCLNVEGLSIDGLSITLHKYSQIGIFEYFFVSNLMPQFLIF